MTFDYGFSPAATLGFNQRISLGYKWGEPASMERRAAAPAKTYAYRATGKSAEYLSSAENFFSLGAVEESKEELAKADRAMGPQDMGRIRYFQLMGDIAFAQNDIKAAKQLYTKSLYLKSAVKRAFQKAHSIRSSPEIRRLVDSSDQDK